MKLWKRKTLLIIFFLFFFILAPILVLYAIGYRYDFKDKTIRKVGMLIIESQPRDSNVFINGKLKAKKTPYKNKNLLPGEYNIRVAKRGYISWEKNLPIESKLTTWADALLFLEQPDLSPLTSSPIDNFAVSDNQEKIIYAVNSGEGKGLWTFDLKSKEINKLYPKSQEEISKIKKSDIKFSDFSFTGDNQKILFAWNKKQNEKHYFIINPLKLNELINFDKFGIKLENVKLDNNSNKIFFLNQKNLYQFDTATEKIGQPIAKNVLDYDISGKNIFCIIEKDNQILLTKLDKDKLNSEEDLKILTELVINKNLVIKANKNEYLAILDNENGNLYISDNNGNVKLISKDRIKKFVWANKENKLLFYNDYEIWFYHLVEKEEETQTAHPQYEFNQKNLLTRLSKEIKKAIWYPDDNHIIFLTENSIKIGELDGRGKRNFYTLPQEVDKNSNIASISRRKGEFIYFLDKGTRNLYQAKITERGLF